jgi:hypothetical protein
MRHEHFSIAGHEVLRVLMIEVIYFVNSAEIIVVAIIQKSGVLNRLGHINVLFSVMIAGR